MRIWMYTDGTTRWNLRVPVVGNALMYLVALVVGTVISSSITWSAEKESRLGNKC